MKPSRPTSTPRQKRAAQKREGIVVLIVMLVLLMATGTAVFAVQSTQYEQRSSTAVGEANWARGLAECTTMAGLAYAEDPLTAGPTLGAQWLPSGAPAEYARKYGIPEPAAAITTSITPDPSGSVALVQAPRLYNEVAPFTSNTLAGGLTNFLPTERGSASATYPLHLARDSQFAPINGLHYFGAHWLQETLTVQPSNVAGVLTGRTRRRTVITGFAEVRVWGDLPDSSVVRDLHELDAVSRGYIDKIF